MKFTIVSVGKWKASPEKDIFEKYLLRLPKNTIELIELEGKNNPEKDGDEILKNLNNYDYVISLDEHGDDLSTMDFFKLVNSIEVNSQKKRIVIIIGGSDGLHNCVKNASDRMIRLGKMTWPHMLVRGLIAEQIYRIIQIKNGHPYHRE